MTAGDNTVGWKKFEKFPFNLGHTKPVGELRDFMSVNN